MTRGFCKSGKLVEKYDVVTAREGGGSEYPAQDGFGWTNGVTMALIDPRLSGPRPLGRDHSSPGSA